MERPSRILCAFSLFIGANIAKIVCFIQTLHISYLPDTPCYLFRMVDKQLAMIQFWENFYVHGRAYLLQMFCLRLGDKGFKRAVPIVYILSEYGFQLVGINGLVSIQNGASAAIGIYFSAFIQKHIEVMGMEYPLPESRPMIAGPYIDALVITKWSFEPFGEGQQRRRIHDSMVYNDFITLKYTGEYLASKRKSVSTVQMFTKLIFHIIDNLSGLIINGSEPGIFTDCKPINLDGNYMIFVLQQVNQRKENLI